MKGITINGEGLSIYIERELIKEIKEVYLEEGKVSIYRNPMQRKNWSPYRVRNSKVRIMVINPVEKIKETTNEPHR